MLQVILVVDSSGMTRIAAQTQGIREPGTAQLHAWLDAGWEIVSLSHTATDAGFIVALKHR